jgi:anti-sigma regulatory factor (Ser/Thr protein kinase)
MSLKSDMEGHHLVTITRGLAELPRVIDLVDDFCDSIAATSQDAHSLHLAIEEAVSNVLQHGYAGLPRPLSLSLQAIAPDRVRATVTDRAPPFNPLSRPEVDTSLTLEERAIGGLGVHLVKKLMDTTHYERRDGQNILTMELKLGNAPQ